MLALSCGTRPVAGKGYLLIAKHSQATAGATADHPRPPRRTSWLTAIMLVFLLAGGVAACQGPSSSTAAPAPTKTPTVTRLCGQAGWPETPVDGGAYMVQNDEWNSTAAECITTDGHAQFTVASSSIYEPASGDPGGYPL